MTKKLIFAAALLASLTAGTNDQFRAFTEASGYVTQAEKEGSGGVGSESGVGSMKGWSWRRFAEGAEAGRRPVVGVSWNDAVAYCNWRSAREHLTPAYTVQGKAVTWNRKADGYRLPTEAEWEYAAKGGPGSPDPEFAGVSGEASKDAVLEVSWSHDNSSGALQPVGTKAANRLGLSDISGNVSQWVWDAYGLYAAGAQTDPAGPAQRTAPVARGGNVYQDWFLGRVPHRLHRLPAGPVGGLTTQSSRPIT